jgi:phage FluMu protein Com
MPIEFRCTQCGKLLRTGDDTAGRQAQCPECGTIRTVPNPAEAQSPAIPSLAPLEGGGQPASGSPFAAVVGGETAYQSPVADMHEPSPAERVSGPATALMVFAILCIIMDSLIVLGALTGAVLILAGQIQPDDPSALFLCGFYVVWGLVFLAISIVVLMGARRMKNLTSYGFAMTAAILAMIPCLSSCWLIGLPFGIWAIVVLGDNSVKAAFRN